MTRARIAATLAAVALSGALAGCRENVDLGGIRAMARTATDSHDALLAVPSDFYESCVRENAWNRGALLSLPHSKTFDPTATTTVATPDPFDVTFACAPSETASEQMIATTSALLAYFAALDRLAATGTTQGFGFKALGATFGALDAKSEFTRSGKTAAVASALDALGSQLVASEAKSDLAGDVTAARSLVDAIVGRLATDTAADGTPDNVASYYARQLAIERAAMHAFYDDNIGATRGGLERLEAFRYREDEAADDARIDRRLEAVAAYRSALDKLRTAHDAVASAAMRSDYAAIENIAAAYVALYDPEIESIRKAFAPR